MTTATYTDAQRAEISQRAADKIEKAKLQIISRRQYRFWGDILKREFREDWNVPTGYTNGEIVGYNPAFVDSLTIGQVIFLMVHEILHIKCGHHLRRGQKDPMVWNMAADYVINLVAQAEGLELIPDILLDAKYRNQTEENVYGQLAQQPPPQPPEPQNGEGEQSEDGEQGEGGGAGEQSEDGEQGEGGGAGENGEQGGEDSAGGEQSGEGEQGPADGQSSNTGQSGANFGKGDIMEVREPEDWNNKTEAEKEVARSDHDQQVRKDNMAAQAAGYLPARIKEYFDLTGAPLKDWRAILADFCLSRSRSEYDWNTFNRTYANYNIFLPDLGGIRIEDAAVAIDVSGSINKDQLTRFLVELTDIVTNCEVENTTVFQVNTEITQIDEYMDGDDINPNVISGGGTSFVPPFEYLDKYDVEPEFLIYFTDGYCSRFAEEPEYPVLWVLYEDNQYFNPPYGEVAVMDEVPK